MQSSTMQSKNTHTRREQQCDPKDITKETEVRKSQKKTQNNTRNQNKRIIAAFFKINGRFNTKSVKGVQSTKSENLTESPRRKPKITYALYKNWPKMTGKSIQTRNMNEVLTIYTIKRRLFITQN